MMKLQYKLRNFCCALLVVAMGVFLASHAFMRASAVFADDELSTSVVSERFVTIYDEKDSLMIKTTAGTVREVLEKTSIEFTDADLIEPALDTPIDSNNFNINIHRARPALVIDGVNRRYLMTASYDPKTIIREAGLTVYDGDKIETVTNVSTNFLEAGAVSTYRIERNGGRTVTIEENLPYTTETRYDYNLARGESYLERAGEDGRRVSVYEVNFENNVEVSRTLISEEVKIQPVPEIVVVGAKLSIAPEQETCVGWLREAGVPEEHLEAAIYIIYHESGCRVDATNPYSGAYGIPQALPGNKMATAGDDWETNPITQIRWMNGYVTSRYGGWPQALAFKMEKGWY